MIGPRSAVVLVGAILAATGTWPAPAGYQPSPAGRHVANSHEPQAPAVPQTIRRLGEPGYNIIPASQLHLPAASGPRKPFFRGSVPSRTADLASGARPPARPLTVSNPPAVYKNLNKPGMSAVPFLSGTPPDSTGAIGPTNYVEMDNSNIAVYDRSLNQISTTDLNTFTGQAGLLCDVQVQWAASANRWLFSFLYCNTSTTTQLVFFGWTKTADPTNLTTGWCIFAFGNSPYLFDYDKLGHNSGFLIVGGNLYDETVPTTNPPFVGAAMEWAPLPAIGDASCTQPAFAGVSTVPLKTGDGTTLAFTPVPVNTDANALNDYVVAAYDPAGNIPGPPGARTKLTVWHLDSAGVLRLDGDLTVNSYSIPASAPQPGTTKMIDTLDGRLTQAEGNPTTGMYTQHTVNGAGGQSKIDWYEVTVSGTGAVSLAQQGSIANAGYWSFNAAISPRSDGQGAAIFYNVANATVSPQVWAQVRQSSTLAGTFQNGTLLLVSSSAADLDFSCANPTPAVPCRWGDYSGASPDPMQPNVVWGTNMFNTGSDPLFGLPFWSDQNFAVVVPEPRTAGQSTAPSPPPRQPVHPSTSGPPSGR